MAGEILPRWVRSFRLSLLTLLCWEQRQNGATRQLWCSCRVEQGGSEQQGGPVALRVLLLPTPEVQYRGMFLF